MCENTGKGEETFIMTYKIDEIYVGNHHLWMWCTHNHFFNKTGVFLWVRKRKSVWILSARISVELQFSNQNFPYNFQWSATPPPAKIQLLLALVEHGIRTWSEWILHLKRALNYIFLYLCCNLISIIFFVNIVYKLNTRRTMIYAFPPCTLSDTICCQ